MDDFEPIEEHKDFEAMGDFEPKNDFSPQNDFSSQDDFQSQSFGEDFGEKDFEVQDDFSYQNNFHCFQGGFQPEQDFGENFQGQNDNFEPKKSVDDEENNESDEDIKKFKKFTMFVFVGIVLILAGVCYLAFFGARQTEERTEVVVERKQPTGRLSELKVIPNRSAIKANERFKFNISRDVMFTGQLDEVLLAFEIPEDVPYRQKVDSIKVTPTPEKFEHRPEGTFAVIRLTKPRGKIRVSIDGYAKVQTYTAAVAQKFGKNIDGKLSAEEKERYTSPERNIESNDKAIKAVSAEYVTRATNDLDTVKNIFDFVVETIKYSDLDVGKHKGAIGAIRSKRGVCTEFADLMVALCRSKGIPARVVYGFDVPFVDMQRLSNNGHAWVEAYTPEYGWVTFDSTNKASKSILKQAKELGITPYELLSYAFQNRIYLIVDTNEIEMSYKGDGDISSNNLQIKFGKI